MAIVAAVGAKATTLPLAGLGRPVELASRCAC
jgi:hypothetical protein